MIEGVNYFKRQPEERTEEKREERGEKVVGWSKMSSDVQSLTVQLLERLTDQHQVSLEDKLGISAHHLWSIRNIEK
jgi:hypothetical protein